MNLILVIAGIACTIALSAFFSATEMTYSSCNILRLENARDEGNSRARCALKITDRFDDALSAILIGNNLANIASSSLCSVLVILLTGSDEYTWVATVAITVMVIILGETVPKISAKKNANRYALSFAYPTRGLILLLRPLVWLTVKSVELLTRGIRPAQEDNPEEAVEELQSIIETAEDEQVIDEDRSELVQAAIDFPEISAFEVMTARVDVVAIDISDTLDEIANSIQDCPYSRLPVYEGSIDNIIGILSLNHLLKAMTEDGSVDIRTLLMPAGFVYKTAKLPAVLNTLRKARQHLAIVTDEYGGTLGVVSMEDVLEQLVGEIWDETDTVEQEVVCRKDGEYELDGDMTIPDFLELLGLNEDSLDCDSETVGGWTIETFGDFPQAGDSFPFETFTVTVLKMDGRRVEKVLVRKDEKHESE